MASINGVKIKNLKIKNDFYTGNIIIDGQKVGTFSFPVRKHSAPNCLKINYFENLLQFDSIDSLLGVSDSDLCKAINEDQKNDAALKLRADMYYSIFEYDGLLPKVDSLIYELIALREKERLYYKALAKSNDIENIKYERFVIRTADNFVFPTYEGDGNDFIRE